MLAMSRTQCSTPSPSFTRNHTLYADLTAFLADLDKRKLLERVPKPTNPDLEIAAVTERACKSPRGGSALLSEKPISFDLPVAPHYFRYMDHLCRARPLPAPAD